MSLTFIGNNFPEFHRNSLIEHSAIAQISKNINIQFPTDRNLLINGTWFGPSFNNIEKFNKFTKALSLSYKKFNNIFFLVGLDPIQMNSFELAEFIKEMGDPKFFKLGQFDNSPYTFNLFASAFHYCIPNNNKIDRYRSGNCHSFNTSDFKMGEIVYKFANYNGKPTQHRTKLLGKIIDNGLERFGINTINDIEISTKQRHLSGDFQPYKFWKHHFLNIVNETTFNHWDDIFISEKTFKPIIGLRPFIINGNWKTYKWLEDNGFRTFEKYFPFAQFRDLHEDDVHPNIIKVIKWVCNQSNDTLLELYNEMLPDLLHNRNRMFEYSSETAMKIENVLL